MKSRTRAQRVDAPIDPREFYTVVQIADLLKVDETTICRSAKLDRLPYYRLIRMMRLLGDDVKGFIEKRRTSSREYTD